MTFYKIVGCYFRETAAAIVIAFALMAPVMIGAAGMALDTAQAYLVRERLAHALDAAALAGAAMSSDPTVIEARIKEFFERNYPPEKIGATVEPVVTVQGNEIHVTGQAYYYTSFLTVLGIDTIDIQQETTVQRQVQGIEVALVLDNTGSMSSNNNIQRLKEASNDFIRIMFESATEPEHVKIGLVPYASSVRIGSYGLGLNPDGSVYADGEDFVNLPSGYSLTNDHEDRNTKHWYGCTIEYNEDGWNPDSNYNDPYPHDVRDDHRGLWDIYMYETYQQVDEHDNPESCSYHYYYGNRCYAHRTYYKPNYNCPYAQIVPLTNDRDALEEAIDGMVAHGYTLGNIGMTWGGRLISPEFPFEEASSWESLYWKKAIVMMTDGNNTRESNYSAYWRTRRNDLNVADYNQRFEETCELLKEKGVLVYTVTFTSGINDNTKGYYERCATSKDYYIDAPDADDLEAAFQRIARELSNLYIKG